ncbi:alanine racemase [Tunturibacter empetritectus]|uniref:Alanine racemase n=1 Tax=Tunturiibacter empetritectus TaxID=3069691 RepID=A0A7W8II12_9BACT|nr:alanine racemase [Edaphobacter lichenicola]MBB5317539.1 alanine racemase [Edaphobacter lichenicola]
MKSWVEVSERRLAGNYGLLREAAGRKTAVLAVVKANAYGHGAAVCAPVLARAGAEWLGVTDVAEGAAVREALTGAGISRERQPGVLVMSGLLREDAGDVIRYGLTPVVWLREQMEWLVEAAVQSGGGPVAVHVEIDTGMARQGVAPEAELEGLLAWVTGQTALRVDGVMTHFASSEVAGSSQTALQRRRFEEAMGAVAAAGLRPAWVHAGNSSTVDNQGSEGNLAWLRGLAGGVGARSMVRAGIALYGYCLPIEGEGLSAVRQELQPVMTWKTRVIGVREVQAGERVGYNGIFVVERAMRLALLPVGYADGLRRELSASNARPGGWAMVRGQRAAIVGRVSMNLTIVDVSGIAGIALGDEVVVLGDGVTAEDHARLAGTIAYEIVCGVQAAYRCGIAG